MSASILVSASSVCRVAFELSKNTNSLGSTYVVSFQSTQFVPLSLDISLCNGSEFSLGDRAELYKFSFVLFFIDIKIDQKTKSGRKFSV